MVVVVLLMLILCYNDCYLGVWVLFLNYVVVDLVLINEVCSFWYFCFDVLVDMCMYVLMEVICMDKVIKKVYLIG